MSKRPNGNPSGRRLNSEDAAGENDDEEQRPNRSKRPRNSSVGRPPSPPRPLRPPRLQPNQRPAAVVKLEPESDSDVESNETDENSRPFPPFPPLRERERPPTELPKAAVKCRCCAHWFEKTTDALTHESMTAENPQRPYQCSFCSQNFSTNNHRNMHERQRHLYVRDDENRAEMGAVEVTKEMLRNISVDTLDMERRSLFPRDWSAVPRSGVVNRFQPPGVVPNDRWNASGNAAADHPTSSGMPTEAARRGIRPTARKSAGRLPPVLPPPLRPADDENAEPPVLDGESPQIGEPPQIEGPTEQPAAEAVEQQEAEAEVQPEVEVDESPLQPPAFVPIGNVMAAPPSILYYNRQEAQAEFNDLPAVIFDGHPSVEFLFVRSAHKQWEAGDVPPPAVFMFPWAMAPVDGRPSNILVFGRADAATASVAAISWLLCGGAPSSTDFLRALAAWTNEAELTAAFFLSASESAVDLRSFPNVRVVQ